MDFISLYAWEQNPSIKQILIIKKLKKKNFEVNLILDKLMNIFVSY